VSSVNAGVDDIGAGSCTGAVVVDVGSASLFMVGDTTETPRGIVLRSVSVDGEDGILLNVVDLSKHQNVALTGLW
jgi:hypothetical protein